MTREEAIKRLESCDECGDCLTCAAHDEALGMAIAALREQETATNCNGLGGWISVEERLPEVGQRVLVCSLYDLQNIGWHLGDGRWQIKTAYPDTPTHWMPLPEPPEVEA